MTLIKNASKKSAAAVRIVFAMCALALSVFLAAPMRAQDGTGSGERKPAYPSSGPYDLAKENLDRVAATAEQILEVVNKDSGLMVELKRVLAQDAGANGQLIDEGDLSEAAIAEKLRQDLRTRVLATRLLQRYGYLQPKINPESELAYQHNLDLQERTRQITRAAERVETPVRNASERNVDCDPEVSRGCQTQGDYSSPPNARPRRLQDLPPDLDLPDVPATNRDLRSTDNGIGDSGAGGGTNNRPNGANGGTSNGANGGTGNTVLASAPLSGRMEGRLSDRGTPGMVPDRTVGPVAVANGEVSSAAANVETAERDPAMRRNATSSREARSYDRTGEDRDAREMEPVRMVRRPNPYADAPSLYDLYVQAAVSPKTPTRFGLDVFRRESGNQQILPMDLPVGPDYVVGPGDSLSIDLWGGVAQRLLRTVDREGRVTLPEAGPLLVSGKSLGEVQDSVQRVLRMQYRNVSADVSLLRLRSVRVYVVGEVTAPGAYDVGSLSTPLNALFAAGGVTGKGSLRHLEHYRGKQLLEEVDAYDLLLHGVRANALRLENGDSLRVPPLGASVTVDGMVRRPATYELRDEKNLSEVLELAGGILPAAALRHIEVQRLAAHEKRTMLSLDAEENSDSAALRATLDKFLVQDGDEIHIFPIAPYNNDAVYLEGHVLRPGRYSYRDGMKLSDLISSYRDLLPEPAAGYAEIIRITAPDNRPVVKSFNLADAVEHPENAPTLKPLDTVRIFGRFDLENAPEFSVLGEVRQPGRYRASGQEHLRDAVYQAGGMTPEAWLDSAQLFRAMPDGSTKVFSISLRDALAGDALNNILVEPRDRILIHRQPEKVSPRSVYVRGDVAHPGRYPLAENMRVADLVQSAGGLLRSANATGGDLTRYAAANGKIAATGEQTVNLEAALAGTKQDNVALSDGDVLTVPQIAGWKDVGAAVTLSGEVARPGVYGIEPGERLSSLLRRAGGMLDTAYPQATVFERIDVRKMQEKTRQDLVQRLEQESVTAKAAVNSTGTEEATLQQAAVQQRQRMLEALRNAPVSGRLVVHLREGKKDFVEGSPDDVELRAGDTIEIPKQPGFVLIAGQVYNANAITYTPGKNAAWYVSRAGGATGLANKKAIFIIRANGSVSSASSGLWSGGVLSEGIAPGDTIVVPERAVLGGNVWRNVLAIAQIAQAGALAAAVAIP